jgi:hypothetical protein
LARFPLKVSSAYPQNISIAGAPGNEKRDLSFINDGQFGRKFEKSPLLSFDKGGISVASGYTGSGNGGTKIFPVLV